MNSNSRNLLWFFLVTAAIVGMLWQFYPLPDALDRMNALPLSGKGYIGKNVPLTPFELSFFKGVNVIKRIYNVNGQNFFITALDGTHNRHIVHDPYYCFKGTGWTILSERSLHIPNGKATILEIAKDDIKKEALFWFSDGSSPYSSPVKYWLQATLRRVTLGFSGPEPILIIVQPLDDTPVDWEKFHQEFQPLFKL